jgi:NADPH2:quinone reductase
MRAYVTSAFDVPPSLQTLPVPDPAPGCIRLRIAACGLNFADLLMQTGRYQDTPDPPFVLGMEVAGRIDALGPGVVGLAPGDRVAVFGGSGGLAEYGCFPAERAVLLPDTMSWTDAAAFQVAYGTSHLALVHRAALQAGETLLVLGAAGGVGLTAVEIGALTGARVIACARGADRLKTAARAGAHHLIDSETDDLRTAVKALGGADVVYDPVGGALFDAAFRACRPEARLLTIGFASGDVPQIKANHLLVKNLTIMGLYWGGYLQFRPKALTDSLATLMDWHAQGRIKPHIGARFPLDSVADGMALLKERKTTGKVVIEIADL